MVNRNLYLVITLVVLQCYYLSQNIRQLSLYIQHLYFCHQTSRATYIFSEMELDAFFQVLQTANVRGVWCYLQKLTATNSKNTCLIFNPENAIRHTYV